MNGEERQLDYREKLHSTPIHIIERRFVRDSWSGGVAPLRCQCKRGRWGRNQMLSAQLSPHMSWMMAKTRRCSSSGMACCTAAYSMASYRAARCGYITLHQTTTPQRNLLHHTARSCLRKHFQILQRKSIDRASTSPKSLRKSSMRQVAVAGLCSDCHQPHYLDIQ